MMGHADISTTTIYVHHVPQTDAAARLSALLDTGRSFGPHVRWGQAPKDPAVAGGVPGREVEGAG
jgi:hypothetical protein